MTRPHVAVVRSGADRNASGMFSEFASVIGALDEFERGTYAGVRVTFDAGLYYDPAVGSNWWDYYFAPIAVGDQHATARSVGQALHDRFANRVESELTRSRAAALVARYVHVQPSAQTIIDQFVNKYWRAHVVGVHYRGTDKFVDAPRVPYDIVARHIEHHLAEAGPDARIFVATDEAAFVDHMEHSFPGRILKRDMFRSQDGRPIDVVNADSNHVKGLHAVVDCLLLARTHVLIRTASNLGLAATFFNPVQPVLLLNPER